MNGYAFGLNEDNESDATHYHWQRDVALARIAALEKLCAAYRTGSQPSETLHRELARTRTRMDDAFPDGWHPRVHSAD